MSSLTTALRKAAYAAPLVFAAAAANVNAQGLETGKCYTKLDTEAVLKQEGQMPIIIGDRIGTNGVNVFFVNNKGYGYNVEGDKPSGTPSTKLCVAAAYKDTQLNSMDNPNIPEWGMKIQPRDGASVAKMYSNGARLVLFARTYNIAANGTEILGKYIAVNARSSDRLSGVWSVTPQGIPDASLVMKNFSVTPHMNRLLAEGLAQAPAPATVATLALRQP